MIRDDAMKIPYRAPFTAYRRSKNYGSLKKVFLDFESGTKDFCPTRL